MRKIMMVMAMVAALAMSAMGAAVASSHAPSDNDTNRDNGWAHFNVLDTRIGEVDVEFVSTQNFASCFEWTSDGERNDDPNFNPDFEGLYEFVCVNNSTVVRTLTADEYLEIRLAFGAEADERFDWTRVDVLQATVEDCKNGGWMTFGDFKNQGQCIASFKANENAGK